MSIYHKIRYLISLKSGITYIFAHYFAKIKIDSYGSLPVENILTLHNVIIHIINIILGDVHYDEDDRDTTIILVRLLAWHNAFEKRKTLKKR